ncbi:MAG TPA: alkaline phosphatase family protein [Acidimicrobiales bacterium]
MTPPPTFDRRRFLAGAAGAAGAVLLGREAAAAPLALPDPDASGVDHVVLVMMENRSFDHLFGWVPGARGRQAGLVYADDDGREYATHRLTDYQGCDHPDPDHSFEGGRVQYDGGACDGWLRSGANDEFAIGYYTGDQLPFYRGVARSWTVCDQWYSAIMAETYPNRFYQHAAQTDRIHNSFDVATMPTIWDRLAAAGVDGRYYYVDLPFLALWGDRYLPIARPYAQFLADCAAGTLPAVAFVDPKFLDEGSGTSADDHPHADLRAGQHFLNQVYEAVSSGPAWERTLLVIDYDEWGGFFDHVPPTEAPDVHPEWALRGFRVPAVVVGPRARRRHVARAAYDHTSVLKLVEWRWDLAPLTPRDAAARNLAEVLDFDRPPDLTAPRYAVPPFASAPCAPSSAADFEQWRGLKELALDHGWPIGIT